MSVEQLDCLKELLPFMQVYQCGDYNYFTLFLKQEDKEDAPIELSQLNTIPKDIRRFVSEVSMKNNLEQIK